MALWQAFTQDMNNNPIAWREQLMLKRWRGKWFWRILFGSLVFLFIAPILWGASQYYYERMQFWLGMLVFANIIVYPLVSLRAITIASESVSRERTGRTWELLMLTGVSTWRLVLGKWVGTMRFMMKDFAWLYALRVVTIFWAVLANNLYETYGYQQLYSSGSPIGLWHTPLDLDLFFWTSIGLIFAFTVLELAFSTALGIATAFFNFRARVGSGIAIGVRIGIAIALCLGLLHAADLLISPTIEYSDNVMTFLFGYALTFLDNGMIFNAAIAIGDTSELDAGLTGYFLSQILALMTYATATIIAIEVARTIAYRVGVANPDALAPKLKQKRVTGQAPQRIQQEQKLSVVDLANAENYSVEVFQYNRRIGRLTLRLVDGNKVLYATFANVQYFDAPSIWNSAKFYTANSIDFTSFITERNLTTNSLLNDVLRLYKVEGNESVHIIASTATVSEELPRGV